MTTPAFPAATSKSGPGHGTAQAIDLGSTNGSYVNGHKVVGSSELLDGSTITMGRTKDHLPLSARQHGRPRVSELTITALRFGFLLLLWVLIFSIVAAMRRDLMIGRKAAAGAPTARQVRKNPSLAEPAPAPVKQQARQLMVTEGPLKGTTIPLAVQLPSCSDAHKRPPLSWRTTTPPAGTPVCFRRAAVGSSRTSAPPTARIWQTSS